MEGDLVCASFSRQFRSDNAPEWKLISEEEKKALEVEFKEDGVFW